MKNYLLILLVTMLVYGGSVRYGFSQDDFYFLVISRARSLGEFFQFFLPSDQQGFPFFRPLGTQAYYHLFVSIWDLVLAPYAMHVFMLLVQSTSGYLVYHLVGKLKLKAPIPLLAGLLYATSSVHFLSLFYIAATQQLLATLFSLLSLKLFLDKKYWLSALAFVPALLSKETALVTPAIAFLLTQSVRKNFLTVRELVKALPHYLPYIIFTVLYLLLRFGVGVTVQSEYQMAFDLKAISTLRWYYLFGYGAPEILLNYALPGLYVNFWRFIRDFGTLGLVSTLSMLTLAVTSLVIMIRSLISSRPLSRIKLSAYLLWFVVGVILVLFLPDHRYPHYLDLGLIPLMLLLLEGLHGKWRVFAVILLLTASISAIVLSTRTHWTTGRAKMASVATAYFATHSLCLYDSIYFTGIPPAQELSYTLSIQNGPDALCYPNPAPKVYYQGVTKEPEHVDLTINATELIN